MITFINIGFRKTKIIIDTGFFSNIAFSMGVILILIGLLNYIKLTSNYCYLYMFLSTIGIIIIFSQLLYKSIKSLKYGIWPENPNHKIKLFLILSRSKSMLEYILKNNSISSSINYSDLKINNKENIQSFSQYKNNIIKTTDESSSKDFSATSANDNQQTIIKKDNSFNVSEEESNINFLENYLQDNMNQLYELNTIDSINEQNSYTNIRKYVKRRTNNSFEYYFSRVRSTFFFNIFLLIISVIILIIYYLIFYINYDENMMKEDIKYVNNNWIYTCHEGNFEIYVYFIELILIVWLLIKLKNIHKYVMIQTEVLFIFMILCIWIFLGPLTNVIL